MTTLPMLSLCAIVAAQLSPTDQQTLNVALATELTPKLAGSAGSLLAIPSNLVTNVQTSGQHGSTETAATAAAVEAAVQTWTIPDSVKAEAAQKMQVAAFASKVDFTTMRIDVTEGGQANFGVLVGAGRQTDSGTQVGYVYAASTGTMVQQYDHVCNDCCKQKVLGICVHHSTCCEDPGRGDTAAEIHEITAALEDEAVGYAHSLVAPPAVALFGLGPFDAIRRFLQALWDDLVCQDDLHGKQRVAPSVAVARVVFQQYDRTASSNHIEGMANDHFVEFGTEYFGARTADCWRQMLASPVGTVGLFERVTQAEKDGMLAADTELTYASAVVQRGANTSDLWIVETSTPINASQLHAQRVNASRCLVGGRDELTWAPQTAARSDVNATMNVLMLLSVQAVARDTNTPLAPHVQAGGVRMRSAWLQQLQPHQRGPGFQLALDPSATAMGYFTSAVKNVVNDFKDIISVFGSHSTTTLVKKEVCLGFQHYDQNVSYLPVECLAEDHTADFVTQYFYEDLLWWFGGDQHKMQAALLQWEYAQDSNWTQDRLQVQNVGWSNPRYLHIYKNRQPGQTCSNWVIVRSEVNFELAEDTMVWRKSTSKLGGVFSSEEDYVTQIPHTVTPGDVLALHQFMYVEMTAMIAREQGLPYTLPPIPSCPSLVLV